jgi:hypothetical protein
MKVKRCAVIIEARKGICYQALLTENEMSNVIDLLVQLHGGKVKVLLPKLELTLQGKL